MAQDDPLSTLLPKPPLPRPDRREAAIGEAMRRFDGADEARSEATGPRRAKRPWLAVPLGRPQLGAILATAAVGLIVLPLWTSGEHTPAPAGSPVALDDAGQVAPDRRTSQGVPSSADQLESPSAAAMGDARVAVAPVPKADSRAAAEVSAQREAPSEPPSSMEASERDNAIGPAARQEARLSPPPLILAEPEAAPAPPAPPSAPVVASRSQRDDLGNDVVVTGSRVGSASRAKASAPRLPEARRTSRRGDWNACTVNDPARSLDACAELASGNLAEGLSKAWRGDLDGAISAFGQAIATSPQSGLAYLNRGLAYERKGETDRALADLDRAARHMPDSARAYYNRSLVLRRHGQAERAAADADRAIRLDPRYRAVIQ